MSDAALAALVERRLGEEFGPQFAAGCASITARPGGRPGRVGIGSRASDATTLLFEWHRLALDMPRLARRGYERLLAAMVEIAGADGIRGPITYAALWRLAHRWREAAVRDMWVTVTRRILEEAGAGHP